MPNLRSLMWLACLFGAVFCLSRLSGWSGDLIEAQVNAKQRVRDTQFGRILQQGQAYLSRSPSTKAEDQCPDYEEYSQKEHAPLSSGPLQLPFQRPSAQCRTFTSPAVENVIEEFKNKLSDPDVARLFENCFPNTLDTTIRWHVPTSPGNNNLPETFIVTGDINAEWLRDSYRQLRPYQNLVDRDPKIKELILGAINTQASFIAKFPYCNAFHPPSYSNVRNGKVLHSANDDVFPPVDGSVVFECKYELDSLASFLGLSNEYYQHTKDSSFISDRWLSALTALLRVLSEQSVSTYDKNGQGSAVPAFYRFQRYTTIGTETLNLAGAGNPVNANTSLIRSAFRPSDDATIYQFFIPANAQVAMELQRISAILNVTGHEDLAQTVEKKGKDIEQGIWKHGVYQHPVFGKVFAYEVDGFGGISNMDDANLPSLLSLPEMGFVKANDSTYQNTRKMILSKSGNPYYIRGNWFAGIGGPHVGTKNAWPMSLLVAMRTTTDESEISSLLKMIKHSTAGLGLMHETVDVNNSLHFTRPWFSWANSEFANTIFDIARRYPHLILKQNERITW